MSRISKLLPLILILLMVASAYKLVSDKTGNMIKYKAHIKNADEYFEDGIVVDAVEEIDKAIEINPSFELMLKKGNYYYDGNERSFALKFADTLLEQYPKEAGAYDYALKVKSEFKGFQDCYAILDEAEKRKITSETIEKYNKSLQYKYFIDYKSYTGVGTARDGAYPVERNKMWGFCLRNGSAFIDCVFSQVGPFNISGEYDLAPVKDETGAVFFINKDGMKKLNVSKEIKCDRASVISEDVFVLYIDKKAGYYDTSLKHKFGSYDYASAMLNSVAAVKTGDRWKLINSKGKELTSNTYEDVKYNDAEFVSTLERIFVKTNGKYIMLDLNGKQVGNLQFEDVECFFDKYAAVKINGKWGFVDTDGKIVIKPEYEEAHSFANEFAAVKKDGKWGYIDTDNKMVIENTFFEAGNMNGLGCAFVKSKEKNETYDMLKLYSKNH